MTTAIPNRIRRSVRYASFDLRNENRQVQSSARRERMSVNRSVPEERFRNTQDWTTTMGMSPSGRYEVFGETKKQEKPITWSSVRWSWATAVICLAAVVMIAVLLADIGMIGDTSKQIRSISTKMERVEEKNGQLENELYALANDVSICTEAVKLNLVSSNGATAIALTVPYGATTTLAETENQAQTTLNQRAALVP